jgi:hypothetical protein
MPIMQESTLAKVTFLERNSKSLVEIMLIGISAKMLPKISSSSVGIAFVLVFFT